MPLSDIRFLVASDVLVACLFPLVILFFGYKLFPEFSFSDLRDIINPWARKPTNHGYFSLERAYSSYSLYERLSATELQRMRASYATLGRVNKNIGHKIGYPRKLDELRNVTTLNAIITESIAELALDEFPALKNAPKDDVNSADLGRVRESLKHFVRDWSEEGEAERRRIFTPILDLLRTVDPVGKTVLVPGCGLGRLAWEISQLGFNTTANELSFFMTLSLRFLLSPKTTNIVNEHTLRPYAHWFSHQRSNQSLFRAIRFPDVVPRLSHNFHLVEDDFLKMTLPAAAQDQTPEAKAPLWLKHQGDSVPNSNSQGYDYIVTLFFIDTSLDILATISHIHKLLRPGGTWINLGPLLWTGGGQAKLELSLEEVLLAAEEIGFEIDKSTEGLSSRKTAECEYTSDKNAMMRWTYKAEFWVAHKASSLP
ncbi:N2227-domain-containing protein [Agrocybe pediades]|nr:N2227-domain-containing protein [Agrocybe pediades]